VDFFTRIGKLKEKERLWILVGVAFLLRLYLVITSAGISPDGVEYLRAAKFFLDGDYYQGFSNVFPPFYPVMTVLTYLAAGDLELAGKFVSLFFGSLTVLPVYGLGKRLFNEEVGFYSALLLTFHPYLAQFSGSVLTESTFTFLVAWSVLIGWKAFQNKSWRAMFSVGLLLGIAYLTRPEGIGFVVLFFLWIFFFDGGKFWNHLVRKLFMTGSLLIGTLLFALPYILFLHEITGKWIVSRKLGF
jgi:4-amino-4-deoxy-L-arabinose transferase-like glycosyltransferase